MTRAPATRLAMMAALAAGAIACGGKHGESAARPAPPPPPDAPAIDRASLAEIAAGLEDVLGTMAAIADSTADCDVVAHQLETLFDKSAPLFELAREQGADPDAGPALAAELDARAAAVGPLVERIKTGLARCSHDPAVIKAMERMPTL